MGALIFLVVIVGIGLYFLPSIMAVRRSKQVGPVILINFFFGWSLIGWVIALSMALADKTPMINQTIVMPQGPGAQANPDTSTGQR